MIEIRDLVASYGAFTLHEVTLSLQDGGCLAILGPSGAGKTLLLETVMGARRPDRGCVLLDGRRITDLPPEERGIAYIPQDLALFPHLSVRENILFGLRSRAARRDAADRLAHLASVLRIGHLLERPDIRTLSGGEGQRVALARALIVQPRVLFLDEPFSSLDAATAADLLRVFRRLRRETGTTVFVVTHDLDEACFLADDIAIMMGGRIVEVGPRDQVFRHPRTVSVARFLNIRNIFSLNELDAAALSGGAGCLNGSTHLGFRASDVDLLPHPETTSTGLRARLEDLIPVGVRVIAELTAGTSLRIEATLTPDQARGMAALIGADVRLRVLPEHILYLKDE